jgi:hypothetical protein
LFFGVVPGLTSGFDGLLHLLLNALSASRSGLSAGTLTRFLRMTQEMARMTEQMSRGDLSPEDSKKMGEQMARMAKFMRFMSGLEARPAHSHAQLQKQMDQMRIQMNEMMSNSRMAPNAR